MGRSLGHELRVAVIGLLTKHPVLSPKQASGLLGMGLANVSYHFRYLDERGFIELNRTEPVRGALAHYYGIKGPVGEVLQVLASDLHGEVELWDDPGKLTTWAVTQLTRRGKALGDPTRADIAAVMLRLDEASSSMLSDAVQLPVSAVSYHVRQLATAGFLRTTRAMHGRHNAVRYYELRPAMQNALLRVAGTLDPEYVKLGQLADESKGDDPLAAFGRYLRQAREGAGHSIEDVAAWCEIKVHQLQEIEQGAREPGIRLQAALASAVGISVGDLFT